VNNRALVAGLGALVLIGGIAVAVTQFIFRPSTDKAIGLIPEDAQFYMNVFVRPSNTQKQAIEDLLGAGDVTAEEATDRIAEVVDRALSDFDLTFEDDIDPALGNQASIFAGNLVEATDESAPLTSAEPETVEAALLVAVRDEDRARDLIEVASEKGDSDITGRETYEGYEYTLYDDESAVGFIDGFAVAGSVPGFKAVVDTAEGRPSLEDSDRYQDVVDRLHEDNLGIIYFNIGALVDEAREVNPGDEPTLDLLGGGFDRPFALTVFATSEGVVMESLSPVPSGGPISTMIDLLSRETRIRELPSDSWLAFGVPEVGRFVELFFELGVELQESAAEELDQIEAEFEAETGLQLRKHILDGLKGTRLFVSGGIGPGTRGAVIVDTANEDVAADIVAALRMLAVEQGVAVEGLQLTDYEDGFSFADPTETDSVHVVADGTRVVAGFGTEATRSALEGGHPLSRTGKFGAASDMLGGVEPSLYLDLDPPLAAFRNLVAPQIPDYPAEALDPFLDAASYLVAGVEGQGDYLLQTVVLGVEQD
jgi:hypothetical protein